MLKDSFDKFVITQWDFRARNYLGHIYLLRASIAIWSATIIPIDATIGKKSEFSCDDASSMFVTDFDIEVTLVSILLLALSKEEPNPSISDLAPN